MPTGSEEWARKLPSAELEWRFSLSLSSDLGPSSKPLHISRCFRYSAGPERVETFKLEVSSGENVELGIVE
ncbi:hypothetical protein Mapa_000441 [Marchantia paleacea]|nr:hypothetical protein Mapa_000441 [Marchantia paleacea]